jgi:outer membrane protein TolC
MTSKVWSTLFLLMWSPHVAAQGAVTSEGGQHLLDAVRSAISRHPALEIQRQEVDINSAAHRQASAAFDQTIETALSRDRLYSPLGEPTGFALSPSSSSQVVASYSRLLRSGVTMNGSIAMRRQIDTAAIQGGLTTSSTRVQLVFPLMRGRGTQVTTAGERAAGLQTDSSVLELRHATATLMTRVVSSYWALVAAGQSRAVAAAAADRGALLLDNTRALIAADQSPRSDLASALANAADREAARYVAEQAYVEAREQLRLDMGYRAEDRPEIAALDDFSLFGQLPDVADLPDDAEPFVVQALERRVDYLAAQTGVEAARIARDGIADELRPRLDFSLNVGYTALAEGREFSRYWSAVAGGVEGPDVVARITYRFPLENHLAAGRFAAADARVRQATAARDDLVRSIKSSVIESYGALKNSLLRLERARESVDAFEEALRGEQDKLALGIGSIINLLTIEDRLTAAADRRVAALRGYGQALIAFRFATGSLVPVRGELAAFDERTFTTFPFELAAGRP